MEKQKKAPDGKGQEQQKPASMSAMKQEPLPEIPGKQESGQEFKLEGIHKAESKPVAQNKQESKPDEKDKSKKKKKDKPYEKWLYGMAGFGLGSLTTYLIMDHKHKKELELNGIEREAEEEARKLKARKKIVFVLE
jgi:hypothetical protein